MAKYHINPKTGGPSICTATKKECKYATNGETPPHYESETEARKAYENSQTQESLFESIEKPKLVEKHGVKVIDGAIAVSGFAQNFNRPDASESHYEGSWEELSELVKTHWENNEPGTGSVDGDVLLINVPPKGFYTPIVEVTTENEKFIIEEDYFRQEGEKPVKKRTLPGFDKSPAKFAKIVVYRADVLEKDSDRSSDAEWEIIAILAQDQENVPMDPETMKRNNENEVGGTYREYTQKEWDDAHSYWNTHVKVSPTSDY